MFDTTTDIPASLFLSALAPKTLAALYLDTVDSYEWIKSEDCKAAARASQGGALAALDAELRRRCIEFSAIGVNDQGHPCGEAIENAQREWFDQHSAF